MRFSWPDILPWCRRTLAVGTTFNPSCRVSHPLANLAFLPHPPSLLCFWATLNGFPQWCVLWQTWAGFRQWCVLWETLAGSRQWCVFRQTWAGFRIALGVTHDWCNLARVNLHPGSTGEKDKKSTDCNNNHFMQGVDGQKDKMFNTKNIKRRKQINSSNGDYKSYGLEYKERAASIHLLLLQAFLHFDIWCRRGKLAFYDGVQIPIILDFYTGNDSISLRTRYFISAKSLCAWP